MVISAKFLSFTLGLISVLLHVSWQCQCDVLLAFRTLETLQESLSEATNQSQRIQELLDRANEDHKTELSSLNTQHEKTITQLKAELEELVGIHFLTLRDCQYQASKSFSQFQWVLVLKNAKYVFLVWSQLKFIIYITHWSGLLIFLRLCDHDQSGIL